MNRYIIGAAVFLLISGSAMAIVWAIDGPPGRHMGPPAEAVEACKDKSEGDKVEITSPRGEKMNAVCKQIQGQLVAIPEDGFGGQKGMLPGGMKSGQ